MTEFKSGCICSAETGEVIYKFTAKQLLLGKQYLTAFVRGQFWTIEKTSESCSYGHSIIFYVR